MLNLKLRDEFLGSKMPGTAIVLRREENTGAAQGNPDVIRNLEIIGEAADGRARRTAQRNDHRLP